VARALRVGRVALVALLVPLMVFAATGWLYLMRGHIGMPGPRMPEALPLDELPGRASVPVLPFVVAWGGAGLVLGRAAAAARIERLWAAPLLGMASGALLAAATWLSILVVRQIPSAQALDAALAAPAVYAAAVLVTLGAVLAPRPSVQSGRERDPDDDALWREQPDHGLPPRLLAHRVQQLVAGGRELVGRRLHRGDVGNVELDAGLRNR
jgi:hypothetical protein